jgi:hypothetical protein
MEIRIPFVVKVVVMIYLGGLLVLGDILGLLLLNQIMVVHLLKLLKIMILLIG